MGKLLIMAPRDPAAIRALRGLGQFNLVSADPKEVWCDLVTGSEALIELDFGLAVTLDTVALAAVYGAAAGASWTLSGGLASYTEIIIQASSPLRAADAAGQFPATSHALWTGAAVTLRYLRIALLQPLGEAPLMIGRVLTGKAFAPQFGHEWGAGRGVIDTGSATRLPSGGFAVAEGARLSSYRWTFGDLGLAEIEALYELQLQVGQTGPVLVVEDPAATAGLRNRIHYGLLTSLRPFERRNPAQTRWELSMEDWI